MKSIPVEAYSLDSIYVGENSVTVPYNGYFLHVRFNQRWEAFIHKPSWSAVCSLSVSVHATLQEAIASAKRWVDWIISNALICDLLGEMRDRNLITPQESTNLLYSVCLS